MSDPASTRGARKLSAALDRFELARALRGAHAIDVGASTGGFIATMLARGAREVTAIAVGEGRLADALRRDARVHGFERTDFRRASPSLAPGPFDFFSVDVSFMAARNVLPPLALRLRPGAQGVVLLKPHFELPQSRVRDGEVRDPNARRDALERFSARARELGFELIAQIDSPVRSGSGSVELLLHLKFIARSAKLPAPGERTEPKERTPKPASNADTRASRSKRAQRDQPRRADTSNIAGNLRWFAVAAPGLERMLADELQPIETLQAVTAVDGGVEFNAPLAGGFAANLRSRIATRVLLRLGELDAREFAELRRHAARLPFELGLADDRPVRVDVSTNRCRLYHTTAIAEAVLLSASDRIGAPLLLQRGRADDDAEHADRKEADSSPTDGDADGHADGDRATGDERFARLLVRGHEDHFVISLDSSGALLHRRGARLETGRAPLRETLAAGMLRLAGYSGDEPLVNAMCGAGTIVLEAAAIALDHAPGRQRSFALERFAGLPRDPTVREALIQERARARAQELATPRAPLFAFDRDATAIARAQRNAERAGVAHALSLQAAQLVDFAPPCERGLLIANPPYGRRLGSAREARAGYVELVRILRQRWRGFRVALVVPRDAQPATLKLPNAHTYPLLNGGISVSLVVAQL